MEMSEGILLHKVHKSFHPLSKPAIDHLDAAFPSGKKIGIIGPDGSGKTTLLRILAGILPLSSGSCSLGGLCPYTQASTLHSQIGYMPQKFGLYEDLTVLENLQLYASIQSIPKQEQQALFDKLLSFSGLHPFPHRLAGALSGGMKQKLGLCCSLLKKPRFLLLDEPTVGVDPLSRKELWQMVCSLQSHNTTILWTTSYLEEASLCDAVLLLHEGKALFYGPPHNLLQTIEDKVFVLQGLQDRKRDFLLQHISHPDLVDLTIQSQEVRLVLRSCDATIAQQMALKAHATLSTTSPKFEDAVLFLLRQKIPLSFTPVPNLHIASSTPTIAIEARNLSKQFGSFQAVQNIDFTVHKGEIFGLLGPNGSGKSTTFKMLCGLLRPTSGQAFVSGISLSHSQSKARAQIGYMAQKFSLYEQMTLEQNLSFFAGIYPLPPSEKKKILSRMIDTFNLSPFLQTKACQLPLGYKQRLALSCAIMHHPTILFLDEPTAGVDPLTRREFWLHIHTLVHAGMTVMVTTHFLEEAEYCDRIALISQGSLLQLGSPEELKAKARSQALPNPSLEDAFLYLSSKGKA